MLCFLDYSPNRCNARTRLLLEGLARPCIRRILRLLKIPKCIQSDAGQFAMLYRTSRDTLHIGRLGGLAHYKSRRR